MRALNNFTIKNCTLGLYGSPQTKDAQERLHRNTTKGFEPKLVVQLDEIRGILDITLSIHFVIVRTSRCLRGSHVENSFSQLHIGMVSSLLISEIKKKSGILNVAKHAKPNQSECPYYRFNCECIFCF